jgi:hypothetical protein
MAHLKFFLTADFTDCLDYNRAYETQTTVLELDFFRHRGGNPPGLVRWKSTGCYAGDPQNGRDELAWLLN